MNHCIKRFLFKFYALISAVTFIAAMSLFIAGFLSWQQFAGIAAGVVVFAFGIQKQNLAETELFKKLFEQFNERYDAMNDDLNRIYQNSETSLTEAEIKTLYKYFNLCGEEYMYYREGFICKQVWRAWKNGMKFFRKSPRIKKLWDDELCNDSYYGLNF
ncbi:MAG TPA: hypothetical protein VMF08_00200 [Candidatus Sulfotelmatobacter sp.]|nr:hypothetical protein [Candidatus Sulfotelmatobacter sp.]